MGELGESVIENISLTWIMYEDVIKNIHTIHWATGKDDYLIPARLMLHSLETIDFYTSTSPRDFSHGYRFHLDTRNASPDQLPSKDLLGEYLDEVKAKTEFRKAYISISPFPPHFSASFPIFFSGKGPFK